MTQPTQAMLGGDFSQYMPSSTVIPIYDPATGNPDGTGRTQFAGNVIPAGRIDPISAKYHQAVRCRGSEQPTHNNYSFLTKAEDTHDGFNVRGDFNQSAKSQWAFRFSNGLETNRHAGFTDAGRHSRQRHHHQLLPVHGLAYLDSLAEGSQPGHVWLHQLLQFSRHLLSGHEQRSRRKVGIPNLKPGPSTTWGIPSVGFTGDPSVGARRQLGRSVCDQ